MNVVIGGAAVRISTNNPDFERDLRSHYDAFIDPSAKDAIELGVSLTGPGVLDPDADIQVQNRSGLWIMNRGDFHATFDPALHRAEVRQSASRYGLDSVLRVIHSLTLAENSGFLLHAASAIRTERAFVFAGPSGAGKTTISRLAPSDTHLLTDEISYIREVNGVWTAFGTPFSGELARPGANLRAPLETIYLLRHGTENRMEPLHPAAAARSILRNILFFAADSRLTRRIFETVCRLVQTVTVRQLSFVPDARVWDVIQ